MATADATSLPITVIQPRRGWIPVDFRELWAFRELLFFFTWRDIKVRYKQTILGAAWAVLQPLLTMLVFSLFFGRLAKMPSDNLPYPLFSYAALVPWTFFSNGISQTSNSMISNSNLLRKIYFPRLVVPAASILAGLVDFFIAFSVLIVMMAYYGFAPTWNAFWLPALLLLAILTALGVGLWLAALNVQFRDVRHTLPFLTQFWLFATPIAYASSLLPEKWRVVYALNPMVGVVEGFRWALLGTDTAPGPMVAVSTGVAGIVLVTGALYFRRMERTFADIV
jgi:lipopolysaccharide transport system permease protein